AGQGNQAVLDLAVELQLGTGAGGAGIQADRAKFVGAGQVPAHPGQQGQGEQQLLDGGPFRAHGRIQPSAGTFCNYFSLIYPPSGAPSSGMDSGKARNWPFRTSRPSQSCPAGEWAASSA